MCHGRSQQWWELGSRRWLQWELRQPSSSLPAPRRFLLGLFLWRRNELDISQPFWQIGNNPRPRLSLTLPISRNISPQRSFQSLSSRTRNAGSIELLISILMILCLCEGIKNSRSRVACVISFTAAPGSGYFLIFDLNVWARWQRNNPYYACE